MTLQGKPAANRCARKKLEARTGKRGKAIVTIGMAGEDVIVLRWDLPEHMTQSTRFLAQHLKHHISRWYLSTRRQMPMRRMTRRR